MDEKLLDVFVEKVKSAAAANLKAVILYGSAATGEFHSAHSNVNILCVVERADTASIEALHPAVEWWVSKKQAAPLVFTLDDLRRSADVFAIELLDMKAKHRVLYGEDSLVWISVPLRYHKLQVERELRTNWLRLRQALLAAPRKREVQLDIMTASLSSFVTLFRHALIALGEKPAENKRDAIVRVAQLANSDASGFQTVLDFREGKRSEKDIPAEETLRRYFNLVEAVTEEVDRRLDSQA
jgi:predicted nucleotidyltransferase